MKAGEESGETHQRASPAARSTAPPQRGEFGAQDSNLALYSVRVFRAGFSGDTARFSGDTAELVSLEHGRKLRKTEDFRQILRNIDNTLRSSHTIKKSSQGQRHPAINRFKVVKL